MKLNQRSSLMRASFARACGVLAASLFAVAAQADPIDKVIINDGSTVALHNPRHAIDADGNIHIAAQGTTNLANPDSSAGREIYYMMVEPDGTVLIDATIVSTIDGGKDGRPEIAMTPAGKAVITWFGAGQRLRYVLVDPSADDQNGDAAIPAAILDVVETERGTLATRGHHDTEVDAAGVVHVVLCVSGDDLNYLSFNAETGTIVTGEVTRGACESLARPAMALDSAGDVHIAHNGDPPGHDSNRPGSYMMLDGATGAVLIAESKLFDGAVSPHAQHHSIAVDADDIVHIVYGDKRNTVDANEWCNLCAQGGTMIYTRLDPSLDDQSGDAASIPAIRLGDEVELGGLWYAQAFASGNLMHVIASSGGKGGNITHLAASMSTGAVVRPSRVYDAQIAGFSWSRHYPSGAGDRVIWSEGVFHAPVGNGTMQLVMVTVNDLAERPKATQVTIPTTTVTGGGSMFTGQNGLLQLLMLMLAAGAVYRRRAVR